MAGEYAQIGGFIGGVMAADAAKADLKNKQALAEWHAMQAQSEGIKLKTEQMTQSALAQAFQGSQNIPSPEEMDSSTDSRMANQLRRVAGILMPVNPDLGLKYADKASAIDQRLVTAAKERRLEDKTNRERTGSIFASVSDQETYDTALEQARKEGVPTPTWVTGDWTTDQNKVKQYSRSFMKESDQLRDLDRDLDRAERAAERERKIARDAQLALEAERKAKQAAENERGRNERHAEDVQQRDRKAALGRDGKTAKISAIPGKQLEKITKTAITTSPMLEGANFRPKEQAELDTHLAGLAQDLRQKGYSYTEIDEELQKEINRLGRSGAIVRERSTFMGATGFWDKGKWVFKGVGGGKADKGEEYKSQFHPGFAQEDDAWVQKAQELNPGMPLEDIIARRKAKKGSK